MLAYAVSEKSDRAFTPGRFWSGVRDADDSRFQAAGGWDFYLDSDDAINHSADLTWYQEQKYLNGEPLRPSDKADVLHRTLCDIADDLESEGCSVVRFSDDDVRAVIAEQRRLPGQTTAKLRVLDQIEKNLSSYVFSSVHTENGYVYTAEVPDESEMVNEETWRSTLQTCGSRETAVKKLAEDGVKGVWFEFSGKPCVNIFRAEDIRLLGIEAVQSQDEAEGLSAEVALDAVLLKRLGKEKAQAVVDAVRQARQTVKPVVMPQTRQSRGL